MTDDKLSREEAVAILQSRASTYAFLSRVYGEELSEAFLSDLASTDLGEAREEYGPLGELIASLEGQDLGKLRQELAAEYAALFLGMSHRPVSPFESVYTSEDHILMQKSRDEVLADYRREGLARVDEFREPEDHIAIELEFMAFLCQKTIDAIEAEDDAAAVNYLQKQKEFLDKHLLVWVPNFCRDLEKLSTAEFYKAIARITSDLLQLERETIGELAEALSD